MRRPGMSTVAVAALCTLPLTLIAPLSAGASGTASAIPADVSPVTSSVGAVVSPSPSPAPSLTPSPTHSPSMTTTPSPSTSSHADASTSAAPAITGAPTPQGEATSYIVVTHNDGATEDVKLRAARLGVSADKTLTGAVDGFTADLTDAELAAVEDLPGVAYVEPDLPIALDAPGAAVRTYAECSTNSLGRIDDGSTGSIDIGFPVNWFGTEYSRLFINNNGGVSLDDGQGGFSAYRPPDLATTTRPLILPLFTDMDTRNVSTTPVSFGQVTSLDGSPDVDAFCINWVNTGEWNQSAPKFSAQLVIIDQGGGDVDLEFNYDSVLTPTSSSNGALVVGYADPANRSHTWSLVTSSDSTAAFVDGGASALNAHQDTIGAVEGRFVRQIRPGISPTASPSPSPTPTPTSTSSCGITPPAGSYACPTWGLDRIDSRSRTYDDLYTPAGDGSGVVIYVVDTGLNQSHSEFSGRVGAHQYDAVDADTTPQDCHGHGTHVAGTAAGATFGVARGATVVGVRVLDCNGSGSTSGVIAGLNWIALNHSTYYPGQRAVANMSLGGGASKSLDDAVQAVIDTGIPVAVAAGNSNDNALYYSPARTTDAVTVAASDSSDVRAYFSNYGSVVDLFAPGVDVLSAGISSTTATATYSGTSMASPHVAGAAAIYLELNPSASATSVGAALVSAATPDVISDPAGSPNELLYVRSFSAYSAPSSGGGGGGGGGSSSSSSSNSESGSGGGGSLNEIKAISPKASGTPGSVIALAGWGLATTRAVYFDSTPADFRVISDAHVEVTVPSVPPGVYVVHAQLAPAVGRASWWSGFHVLASSATSSPPASGTPGSVIALAGWGLAPTRAVYFASPPADFRVISDAHVEVTVPSVPPGVYVVHAQLAPAVGRASWWSGFHVLASSATSSPPASGTPPATTTPGVPPAANGSAADLVGFRPNSSALSASTKTKLTRLAKEVGTGDATGTVMVFSDKRGIADSKKVARARAKNVIAFLRSEGVTGEIRTVVEKGDTSVLRKSAVVRLSTDPGASTVTTGERVDSLIVRFAKGVSPTQDGQVRGSSYVSGGLGSGMTLGPNLGLRMYRVDFARPVTLAEAELAASQMAKDKGVQFAEPDRIVRANVSAN